MKLSPLSFSVLMTAAAIILVSANIYIGNKFSKPKQIPPCSCGITRVTNSLIIRASSNDMRTGVGPNALLTKPTETITITK